MARKQRVEPPTLEEAQAIAAEIARDGSILECDQCVIAIAKRLGRSFPATFERLRTTDRSDGIALIGEWTLISENGMHVGIRIGDRIIDNLHPDGVVAAVWIQQFVTMNGLPLTRESRGIEEFFGKVFLRRKFARWLAGCFLS